MTTPNKYYVMVPAAFSYNGEPYWQELSDVKTLTSAKSYLYPSPLKMLDINRVFFRLAALLVVAIALAMSPPRALPAKKFIDFYSSILSGEGV